MQTIQVMQKRRSWVIAAVIVGLLLMPLGRPAGAQVQYSVQYGDTLSAISLRYGVSVDAIAELNGIADPDLIVVGQQLSIPGGAAEIEAIPEPAIAPAGTGGGLPVYTVQAGDTLSGIAVQLGVSESDLVSANGIANRDLIVTGQALVVPEAPGMPAPVYVDDESIRTMMYDAAAIHREDPYLMMALAWRESGWQQNVVSSAGAVGIMQLMPETAGWAGPALVGRQIDPVHSAWDNIETGIAFYAHLYSMTGSDYYALAGYYQGPYSVETQGLFPDTEEYVWNILEMRDLFASGRLP